jgi:hypothetical protein
METIGAVGQWRRKVNLLQPIVIEPTQPSESLTVVSQEDWVRFVWALATMNRPFMFNRMAQMSTRYWERFPSSDFRAAEPPSRLVLDSIRV